MSRDGCLPCDLCRAPAPEIVLQSRTLDGPLVRCRQCGLYYVGVRNRALTFGSVSAEETAARVAEANRAFKHLPLAEEHRLGALNARWRLEVIRRFKSGGRLLEVGSGRGDFLREARSFFDVRGVEPSPELAADCRSAAETFEGTIERTPWSDFDVAASFHVIEHVDSPAQFVREIAKRVRTGGTVVIETPNIDSPAFRVFRGRWRQFIPEHYYFFSPATLGSLLARAGLRVEQAMNVGKYASLGLMLNRLSRYAGPVAAFNSLAATIGADRWTFRVNPMDIMLVVATKV